MKQIHSSDHLAQIGNFYLDNINGDNHRRVFTKENISNFLFELQITT